MIKDKFVAGVVLHRRPLAKEGTPEYVWNCFVGKPGYIFFEHDGRILPHPGGPHGSVELATLAKAFDLRPETIRIENQRYEPFKKPDGRITMITPAQFEDGAYQHPSRAAKVTGLPTFKISLLQKTPCFLGVPVPLIIQVTSHRPKNVSTVTTPLLGRKGGQ